AAGFQQPRSGRTMDGAIHAAATQKRPVGGVDDGIDVKACNVGFADFDVRHGQMRCISFTASYSSPLAYCGVASRSRRVQTLFLYTDHVSGHADHSVSAGLARSALSRLLRAL